MTLSDLVAPGLTELAATLVSTAVDPGELDAVAASLQGLPSVSNASWSSSTDD